MLAFAAAIGLDPGASERLTAAVVETAREFCLDFSTLWQARSRSRATMAVGVHHAAHAIGRRRYIAADSAHAVMFNGLPVDGSGRFCAYDATELDRNWFSLPSVLEGQFCVVRIDFVADGVEVLTDPLGIVQVFCGTRGGATVVSSSESVVASVLELDALDPLAISSFVALGWAVERRTFHRGVRMLAGGSVHEVGAHGVHSRQHFGSATVVRRRSGNAGGSELPRALVHLSAEAARAGGPVRCALTAGRDTRVLAALLRCGSIPAVYYTGGDPGSMDFVIAGELAERFDLPHQVEPSSDPAGAGMTAAIRFIRQNDGLASLVQLVDYIDLDRPIAELSITFWGVGGEIGRAGSGLLSNVAPNLPVASRVTAVQRRLLRLKLDDAGLLTPEGAERVTGFLDRFVDERRREGWPVREIPDAFYAFERVSSWGATGPRRAAGAGDLFSPYCTRPFVDYCFSLTPARRYLEAPHRRLLEALAPELLEPRFEQPFRPQYPALTGLLATRQLWRGMRSRQRHGVTAGPDSPVPPSFLDRWLQSHVADLQSAADKVPALVWQLIDRARFSATLRSETDRATARDALLRTSTALLWASDKAR